MGRVANWVKQNRNYGIATMCYLLILFALIPTRAVIKGEFPVHQELVNISDLEVVEIELEYRKYHRIISKNRFKGVLTYKGSKYRFEQNGNKISKRNWIRIRSPYNHIGDLLHNDDLSEFVLILKADSQESGDRNLKFIAYPPKDNEEANKSLQKLIIDCKYKVEWLIDG